MRATEFVHSYINAWNHCDEQGIARHFVKDGTYYDIPTNTRFSRDELVFKLAEFFESDNHHYQLRGEVLSSDSSIAFQYKMTSHNKSKISWWGAEFITLENDGALSITDYYDPTHSTSSLGVMNSGFPSPKYAKSGLDKYQIDDYKKELLHLMEVRQVFLDPEITLPKLAAMVNCSVNHLSQAVNSGFNMSFFDFLNSYRIEEAKKILVNQNSLAQSVLDVSFAVGFNSNSAFYAAFKKSTGQTPAQFRRLVNGADH